NFSLTLDGVNHYPQWPESDAWVRGTLVLTPGTHTVSFSVTKGNHTAEYGSWLIDELQILPPVPIGDAIEQPAAVFTNDGLWTGQTATTFDGLDAVAVLAR